MQLTRLFEKMDKDGSQTLNKTEMRNGMLENKMIMKDDEFEALFKNLDKDGSGTINYTEFMAAAMDINLMVSEKKLEVAFKFFDKDGNGTIDKHEITNAVKKGWISDKQLVDLFKIADANNDEKVIGCM